MPIETTSLDVETVAFKGLQEFIQLSAESEASHQYVVAWLDCMASGAGFGRGIFLRANHSKTSSTESDKLSFDANSWMSVPLNLPAWCLSRLSVRCFNQLYFLAKSKLTPRHGKQSLQSFFYPLDTISNWNRIYGKRGFYQCQFVVPREADTALEDILKIIVDSGQSSFLSVLKEFGNISSPGLMTFPRPGLCLALDFPDRGTATQRLLTEIEERVVQAGGAIYPAKDRSMSADAFQQFFPKLDEFRKHIDPAMSSDFWRRVNA